MLTRPRQSVSMDGKNAILEILEYKIKWKTNKIKMNRIELE